MTTYPDWVSTLRALEDHCDGATHLTAWLAGDIDLETLATLFEDLMLGVSELDGGGTRRCLLSVPARVNELARALGDTYWATLGKAPAKITVSKTGSVHLRNVRYSAVVIDVGAWREWWAKNRGPEALAGDQLRAFVERIENLEEEKQTIADDIKDVYAEAKANGYDTKIMRQVVAIRKKDKSAWEEEQALLDLYLQALGMGFGLVD